MGKSEPLHFNTWHLNKGEVKIVLFTFKEASYIDKKHYISMIFMSVITLIFKSNFTHDIYNAVCNECLQQFLLGKYYN